MSSTTMALGSQPASMPAESNLDQMTHLISPARSELSEIDPSWEIRALADADGLIGTSSADDFGAALCANPHTPVCWSPAELSQVPTVEQAVADDEELAGHEWLVGKRLYDGDDSICAQIVSIDTASSRGHKFEEIRATCVRLDSEMNVPKCAITATGKVSQAQRFTQLFCTLTLIPLLLN